jgi:hypothetical protein
MIFLSGCPGILVGDHLSGHCGRMCLNAPTSPATRFAEPEDPSVTYLGSTRPQMWRLATTTVDQVAIMPTSDSYLIAEIATAITAN